MVHLAKSVTYREKNAADLKLNVDPEKKAFFPPSRQIREWRGDFIMNNGYLRPIFNSGFVNTHLDKCIFFHTENAYYKSCSAPSVKANAYSEKSPK